MLRSFSRFHRSFSSSASQRNIEFLLNGRKVVLREGEFDPTKSLLSWLRSEKVHMVGTKLVCGEGGCGACTVVLTKYDPITKKIVHLPVDSCLMPLGQAHGQSITTIEHLGSKNKGLHPIQKAFVKHHASQCGYCTPGYVMNAYSMLLDNPNPTLQQVYDRFDGNLCRCTGYRSIHDALKEFTSDSKPQDSSISYDSESKTYICPDPALPPKHENIKPLEFKYRDVTFYAPTSLQQVIEIKKNIPSSKLIAGNSETGISLRKEGPTKPAYISLHNVPELNYIKLQDDKLILGAATPLQSILDFCTREKANQSEAHSRLLSALKPRLQTFASTQIRNTASVTGNIAEGGAVTDLSNFLIANNAILTVLDVQTGKERKMTMDNFYLGYRKVALGENDLVLQIDIPLCDKNEHVFVYKQAYRQQDDICIGSATMRVRINEVNNVIEKIDLAYSGLSAFPQHAKHTEQFLLGKTFTIENIKSAYKYLREDFPLPDDAPGGHIQFRRQLSSAFLFRFFHQVEKERGLLYDPSATDVIPRPYNKFGVYSNIEHQKSKCKETFKSVTEPIHHRYSELMTTGEAQYTIDLSSPGRTLYAGVVMSTVPHAKIKKADYSKCFELPGVVDVITYKDVPGINMVGDVIQDEPVFAENEVVFVGQSIALVLAEDNETAWKAAKLAQIEYEELEPCLSIRDAIKKNSYFDMHHKLQRGNPDEEFKNCKHVIEGEFEMGGQEHYYLETQNCIVEPFDNNRIKVTSSTQAPTTGQVQVAKVLGLKMSDVEVDTYRIGGGFGGKETRACCQANMCAVGAFKTKRPVRLTLDRETDMEVSAGRHPMLFKYKVGFNDDGLIHAMKVDIYANCGWSTDCSIAITDRSLFHADGSYYIPHFYTEAHLCKTNLPSNTAFRGFGAPQACFACDEVIDNIACHLKKRPEDIKYLNLYKEGDRTHFKVALFENKLQEAWSYIDKQFNFEEKRKEVDEFNRKNRYKKRGVAMTPLKFGVSFTFGTLNQAGSLVHIYKDGSVLATHGGIEMGQGLNTKLIQIVADTLQIPYTNVRIDSTSTVKVANTSPTAASSGTDLNGWALYNACIELKKRLEKYRTPDRTFQQAVMAAYLDKVNLTANGYYATPGISFDWNKGEGNPFAYYAYGCSAAIAEIDLLTGDHVIPRLDLVYDIGRPINAAIDIGQTEGGVLQGIGLITIEELIHGDNEKNKWVKPGYLKTNNLSYYKIPAITDIPTEFNVSFLPNSYNRVGIYSSKAVGEPPLILANSVGLAIKDAIKAARRENGQPEFFELVYPLTADRIKVFSSAKI